MIAVQAAAARPRRPEDLEFLSKSEGDFIAWMEEVAIEQVVPEEYRLLFARCSEIGVEGAFWEAGKVAASENEILRLRNEAEVTHLFDDYIGELDEYQTPRALDEWRRISSHEEFGRAPDPLQQQILSELAQLLTQQLQFSASLVLADEAINVCERLVATNDEGSSGLAGDLVLAGPRMADEVRDRGRSRVARQGHRIL